MQILKNLHAPHYGVGVDGGLIASRGLVAGADGNQRFYGGPTYIEFWNDFVGGARTFGTTVGGDGVRSRVGTTNAVDWTTAAGAGGLVTGTIGDTTASMAVSGIQLDTGLNYLAQQGGVAMTARIRISRITAISVFVGFTDQVGALEMPIHAAASADTITTNADDAVGFFFDTSMTTDNIWAAGVAATVDATHQDTGFAFVANTFMVLTVELAADGSAVFFRNGRQVGTRMAGAVTASAPLTWVVAAFNRTTTGTLPTVTLDYVHARALRG